MSDNNTQNLLNVERIAKIVGSLAPAGPRMKPQEMAGVVASLRKAAEESVDHVHRITGLDAAQDLRDSEVLVVDRSTWAKANAQAFSIMLVPFVKPAFEKIQQKKPHADLDKLKEGLAFEVGAVLSFLSTKVLGQYEPYAALAGYGQPGGRLMLLAPNVVSVERELNVEPEDFRLWVCLHEQTHRVQFAAAPWLRDYFLAKITELGDSAASTFDLKDAFRAAAQARAEESGQGRAHPVKEATAKARKIASELTAIMSLLEGHANVVMDAVDAQIVPTVKTIRRRFNRRSSTQKFLTKLIYRLLGMNKRWRSTAMGRSSFSILWMRSAWNASTSCGSGPRTCRPSGRFTTPTPGSSVCWTRTPRWSWLVVGTKRIPRNPRTGYMTKPRVS